MNSSSDLELFCVDREDVEDDHTRLGGHVGLRQCPHHGVGLRRCCSWRTQSTNCNSLQEMWLSYISFFSNSYSQNSCIKYIITVESWNLELGYLKFCKTLSVYLNQKYILIAFSNHNLALETFFTSPFYPKSVLGFEKQGRFGTESGHFTSIFLFSLLYLYKNIPPSSTKKEGIFQKLGWIPPSPLLE